ncbi:MAG: MoaD/ThiS family protein [Flavobacteriales bacterium]|nr:MoaD/ThiS family protein [Flavobacteriales bacterium]
MAKIIVPTPLRKFTSDKSSVEVSGNTVTSAILELVNQQPNIKKHLLDENEKVQPFIRIFVGDEDVSNDEMDTTPITETTVISIVPAIAGGSVNNSNN